MAACFMACSLFAKTGAMAESSHAVQEIKDSYGLQSHSEGGWFAAVYTAPFETGNRATAGSIYFLLDKGERSHFHQLDCDEIWYYHAGCGMRIVLLEDGRIKELLLGMDAKKNQQPMVILPAGSIFAAENIDRTDYTFISCMTTPQFRYEGFRLVPRDELKKRYPQATDDILQMAYDKIE